MMMLTLLSALLLVLHTSMVNTCQSGEKYECMGTGYFAECTQPDKAQSCVIFGDTNTFCYPRQNLSVVGACAPPPPPCNAEGRFPLKSLIGRCDIFYECVGTGETNKFTFHTFLCAAPDYEFSVVHNKCMPKSFAGCNIITTTSTTTTTTTTTTAPPPCTSGSKIPDPNSCYNYRLCSDGVYGTPQVCPFGYMYEPASSQCKPSTDCGTRPTTTTTSTTTTTPACTPNSRLQVSTSCKQYRQCDASGVLGSPQYCPFDYYFNPANSQCTSDSSSCGSRPLA